MLNKNEAEKPAHSKNQEWRQYVISGIVNLASFSGGYCLGWLSPNLAKLQDADQSPLDQSVTSEQISWIGSLMFVGTLFGPILGSYMAAKLGRKRSMMIASIPLIIGWILIATTTNISVIYVARTLQGCTCGGAVAVSNMYCAEIATDKARGALGSYLALFVGFGLLMVYSIGPYITYNAVAYIGLSIVGVFEVCLFFMPESPIYLLIQKDRESAAKSLAFIRGKSQEDVQGELEIMMKSVSYTLHNSAKVSELFEIGNFKSLYISTYLMMAQQFSGAPTLLMYLSCIFETAGLILDANISTILISVLQIITPLMTPFIVERLGRRLLLIISTSGCAIFLAILGMYFKLAEIGDPIVDSLQFLPLTSLIFYNAFYGVGLGSLPWVLMSELVSIEAKAIVTPIVTFLMGVALFLVTRFFNPICDAFGIYTTFWIFAMCCSASFCFVLIAVPETKGKSYQEIQDMLRGKIGVDSPTVLICKL